MILGCIFLLLMGSWAAAAVMDKIQFHHSASLFRDIQNKFWFYFWYPTFSWRNKWKTNPDGTFVRVNGELVERFWGSSRWFVFITDGWHLMQFFRHAFIIAATGIALHYNPKLSFWPAVLFALTAWICGGGLKEFMFKTLLKRK